MIHPFLYRLPRVATVVPVDLDRDGLMLAGFTRNISDTGLLACFEEPLAPGTRGTVRLRFGRCMVHIEATVTHTEAFDAGLRFEFTSDHERAFLRSLVKALSKSKGSAIPASSFFSG